MELFEKVLSIEIAPQVVNYNEEGERVVISDAIYHDQTVIADTPITKSKASLDRVLKVGNSKGVDKTIGLFLLSQQWEWFWDFVYYQNDVDTWEKWQPELDEEGEQLAEKPPAPIAPIRPPELTVEQYKASNPELFVSYNKKQGMDYNGVQLSLTEANQNGLTALQAGIILSEEVGGSMFPLNFNAETPSGNEKIPLNNLSEFKALALAFMAERQKFFR